MSMSSLKDAIILELHKKAFAAQVAKSLGSIAKRFGTKQSLSKLSKTKKISIGYSYRLYVNGIPCLDPHKEWIQTLDVKEINYICKMDF